MAEQIIDQEANDTVRVTIDVAATVSAILWPTIVGIGIFLLRDRIPALVKGLVGRITKLDFAGVTLELAEATKLSPVYSSPTTGIDLRQRANAMQISDSTAGTFLDQLRDPAPVDFAVVNLGNGDEWLTSRLYIMAVLFARMKGLRALVFLTDDGTTSRRYLGWADSGKVRWALAKKYPWLEAAYAESYGAVAGRTSGTVVASGTGRLGLNFSPEDPRPSIDLLRAFLERIQWPSPAMAAHSPPSADAPDWVTINEADQTREHASWVTRKLLEDVLSTELCVSRVAADSLKSHKRRDQIALVLAQCGGFVAVVDDDLRFQYLLDRQKLLEDVAATVATADADVPQG